MSEISERIRPSKVVLSYGPGSIVDLPESESVMVMGVDFWKGKEIIIEPRLAKKLQVDYFGSPANKWDDIMPLGIPMRDFPYYRVCPRCNRLWHLDNLERSLMCPDCRDRKTIPARLIAACNAGHVQDFPWKEWCGCSCNSGDTDLYLEGRSGSVESDLIIVCKKCGQKRGLSGALNWLDEAWICSGARPWMGDKEACDKRLKGMLRGSSNVFFPEIETAFSIPPFSKHIYKLISGHYETAKKNWQKGTLSNYIVGNEDIKEIMKTNDYSESDMEEAFKNMYEMKDSNIKIEEWETFTKSKLEVSLGDFHGERIILPSDSPLRAWFQSIAVFDRLREVIALSGFTRIRPAERGGEAKTQRIRFNQLELDAFRRANPDVMPSMDHDCELKWMPGVELFGEGIFLEFNEKRLEKWEAQKEVKLRHEGIVSAGKGSNRLPRERECIDFNLPRTTLTHTLAHLLMKEISLSCGYSQASLRERVYSCITDGGRPVGGVVIYTVSPDSEGSLGGLIAQAKNIKALEEHFETLLGSIEICSQDPLCLSHDFKTTGNPWGASCHSCCQLPETSCEGLQNKLLDRTMLMGSDVVKGYFDDWKT